MVSFNGSNPIEFDLEDGSTVTIRLIGMQVDTSSGANWFRFEVDGKSGLYSDLNAALDNKPWTEHRNI